MSLVVQVVMHSSSIGPELMWELPSAVGLGSGMH